MKKVCLHCEGNGYFEQPYPIYWPCTVEMANDAGDSNMVGSPIYVGDEYEQVPCEMCDGKGYIEVFEDINEF